MDNKKDTLNTPHVSQNNPNSDVFNLQGGFTQSDIRRFYFILKKMEKLSSAIYLITDFVSDNEPLKWSLRHTSLAVLSQTKNIKDNHTSYLHTILSQILDTLFEVESLLEIAVSGRVMSRMNASVLQEEYKNLRNQLEAYGNHSFSKGLPAYLKSGEQDAITAAHAQHKRHNVLYNNKRQNIQKDTHEENPLKTYNSLTQSSSHTDPSFISQKNKKNDRREAILSLLKDKESITIKDAVQVISGCSEKTIQRELVSMVKDNILKRHGERRWSSYTIAS